MPWSYRVGCYRWDPGSQRWWRDDSVFKVTWRGTPELAELLGRELQALLEHTGYDTHVTQARVYAGPAPLYQAA